MKVHKKADIFPMMSQEELESLAADIKKNGLLHPIVVDEEEQIIDGRNRLAACKLAGVKPQFQKLNGHDPSAFIVSANLARRNLTKGQQAMALAMIYPEAEHGGKREKGSSKESLLGFSRMRLSQARSVFRHSEELAKRVIGGTVSLDEALDTVQEENEEKENLERLRRNAPDIASRVTDEDISFSEGLKLLDDRETKRKQAQEVATHLLQQAMIFLSPRGKSPGEWAHELAENVNPKFWSPDPDLDLSVECIRRCAEAFSAFADLWTKESKKNGKAAHS